MQAALVEGATRNKHKEAGAPLSCVWLIRQAPLQFLNTNFQRINLAREGLSKRRAIPDTGLAAQRSPDLNNDGFINVLDLELLARNYRKTGPVVWQ